MSLSLGFKVTRNADEAAAKVDGYPPRLDAAMRRGTAAGTRVLAAAVEELVESRTSMSGQVAARITKSRVAPGTGGFSRGRVWFEKPPARIYPKRGRFLRFKNRRGKEIFVKSVRGSRPYPLIGRAADAASTAEAIEEAYREEIEEVL